MLLYGIFLSFSVTLSPSSLVCDLVARRNMVKGVECQTRSLSIAGYVRKDSWHPFSSLLNVGEVPSE